MGTQTGATGKGTTGVGTGSTVHAISTATWAAALLEKIGAPVTANNIANIQRLIGAESGGNQAGFLRDNNPFNLNTGASPHANLYPGGSIVPEFGIYVQVFDSVEAGITATANQIRLNPALLAVLKNNGSPALFGGALSTSAWRTGSYANAKVFPTLSPFMGTSAVGGQGLTFSPSAGAHAVAHAFDTVRHDIAAPVTTVAGLIGDITNPTKLKNVGIFLAGLALTVGGIAILISTTKTARVVEGTAANAA